MRRPTVAPVVVVASCAIALAIPLIIAIGTRQRAVSAELGHPRDLHGAAFAGADACRRCHPDHVTSWRRTFHRTMTQDVSAQAPGAAAGDFSDVSYRYDDVVARMHRDGAGRFMMTFVPDGVGAPAVEAVVVRAVGSRRYQQYLAEVNGALWRLPMAFHVEEKRWFHMNGAFLTPDPSSGAPAEPGSSTATALEGAAHEADARPPGQPRFGGGAFDRHVTRWNDNCVFCHNVAPNPGRDPATGIFRTSVSELGIACEACHGPGAEHARVNADPVRRYVLHGSGQADPTIVNPARLSPSRSADICGRCHGQRISDDVAPFLTRGDPFVPGDDLAVYTAPLWRDTTLGGEGGVFAARFWDDGTPRLTAYEYQGLLQSRCAHEGALTCTSCHGMHDGDPRGQVRPSAAGDLACTGCHSGYATASEVARHTRHQPTGAGARCVSCHMPRIVYGVLAAHVSHRIEVPDPARAMATGRPDACTLCHVESDRGWAAAARARLWPAPGPASPSPDAPSPAGASSDDELAPRDALFAGDPIARAIAADAIGRAPWPLPEAQRRGAENQRVRALWEAMNGDRYPAVRHLAARALAQTVSPQNPKASKTARDFDATAPLSQRRRSLELLRQQLAIPDASATDAARIWGFRQRARAVDIDIGE